MLKPHSEGDKFRERLIRGIEELKALADAHDAEGIKEELKEIVPEYEPQGGGRRPEVGGQKSEARSQRSPRFNGAGRSGGDERGVKAKGARSLLGDWHSLVNWPNVVWQVFHLATGGVLLVLLWVVLARLWGPDRYGWFNYLFVIITLSGVMADFGLDVLLTRSVASGTRAIPRRLLNCKFVTVLGSLAVFGAAAWCFPAGLSKPFLLLFAGVLLFSITNFLNGFLRGIDRLDLEAKVGLLQKSTFVLGSIFGVWVMHYGLPWVGLCYLISHALGFCLTWGLMLPYRPLILRDALERDSLYKSLSHALPLLCVALLMFLSLRLDIFLLKWLAGPGTVGIYAAAFRFIEGFVLISTAYMMALFPRLVAYRGKSGVFSSMVRRSLTLLVSSGLLAAVLICWLAPYLTAGLMGPAFISSEGILRGLTVVLPAFFTSALLGQILIAHSKQHLYALALGAGMGISVAVDLWTIPLWGAWGAVVGVWVRETFQVASLAVFAVRLLPQTLRTQNLLSVF